MIYADNKDYDKLYHIGGQRIDQRHRRVPKLVLLDDYEQMQGIKAGAAFRVLVERHGAAAIHDIRRQPRNQCPLCARMTVRLGLESAPNCSLSMWGQHDAYQGSAFLRTSVEDA